MISNIRESYGVRADEYIEALGNVESMSRLDRQLIEDGACRVDGRILDAGSGSGSGSGSGHWAAPPHDLGLDIEGIDLVQAFIDSARARFPQVKFQQGSIEALTFEGDELAGLLAWYSVIHLEPERLIRVGEFPRCVTPGGSLLIGFFEGPRVEPFDHAVTTAYFWPVAEMTGLLDTYGFETIQTHTRTDIGSRPHAAIVAGRKTRKPGTS